MLTNNLKIFLRNLRKHSGYSISNIIGLTVGMVTCILILLYIRYEFSWNTSFENHARLYRVQHKVNFKNGFDIEGQTGYALAEELERQIPEIEETAVLREVWSEYLSSGDERSFHERGGFYAHNDVFQLFSFRFIAGDAEQALTEPHSMVLSQSLANKYFPGEEPLGKMLKASQNKALKVTGIYADVPENSTFRPDYLVSFATFKQATGWQDYDELKNISIAAFRSYVLLRPNVSAAVLNEKLAGFLDQYVQDNTKKAYLKPIRELHLSPNERNDVKVALYYLGGVALLVLVLACVNFINLATASSNLRTKEIGVRKVIGAGKFSLFRQFIGETMSYAFLAFVLALLCVEIVLPYFNVIVERPLTLHVGRDFNLVLWMLTGFLITGFLAGIYPALVLSTFQPVDVIKGKQARSKSFLRKGLVAFQFYNSLALLLATTYVIKQVDFMKNKDLGFVKENLLLCNVYGDLAGGRFETLKSELLRHPNILNATVSYNAPFNGYWNQEVNWQGGKPEEKINMSFNAVDYNFIDTYQMRLKNGRNFSPEFATDRQACLVNETACRIFGWENPIGQKLDNDKLTVIGVVEDYHPYSVHAQIPPAFMTLHSGNLKDPSMYTVRIRPEQAEQTVESVSRLFRQFFPDAIVEVSFFDENLDLGTRGVWEVLEKIFFAFSIIAMLIAANGLFGLISFAAQRRIKEIGIRKIVGANVSGLYLLMSKEFLLALSIAVCLALPVGYIVSITTPGAYKYQMQFFDYFGCIALLFVTAFAAAAYHTTKAVLANPVVSLRHE